MFKKLLYVYVNIYVIKWKIIKLLTSWARLLLIYICQANHKSLNLKITSEVTRYLKFFTCGKGADIKILWNRVLIKQQIYIDKMSTIHSYLYIKQLIFIGRYYYFYNNSISWIDRRTTQYSVPTSYYLLLLELERSGIWFQIYKILTYLYGPCSARGSEFD